MEDGYEVKNGKGIMSKGHGLIIASHAFERCADLKSIVIPNTVQYIGDRSFFGCSELESVVIPESVTEIGEGAFMDCPKLKSVKMPSSLECIGDMAFSGCSSLKSINIPSPVSSIKKELSKTGIYVSYFKEENIGGKSNKT